VEKGVKETSPPNPLSHRRGGIEMNIILSSSPSPMGEGAGGRGQILGIIVKNSSSSPPSITRGEGGRGG